MILLFGESNGVDKMKKVLQIYKHTDTLIVRFPEMDYDHTVSRQVKKSLPGLIMKYSPKSMVFDLKQSSNIDKEGLASLVLSWNLCCTRNVQLILTGMQLEDRDDQGITFLVDTAETLKEALQLAINSAHVQKIHTVVTKNMTKVFGDQATNPLPAMENRIVKIKQKIADSNQKVLTA